MKRLLLVGGAMWMLAAVFTYAAMTVTTAPDSDARDLRRAAAEGDHERVLELAGDLAAGGALVAPTDWLAVACAHAEVGSIQTSAVALAVALNEGIPRRAAGCVDRTVIGPLLTTTTVTGQRFLHAHPDHDIAEEIALAAILTQTVQAATRDAPDAMHPLTVGAVAICLNARHGWEPLALTQLGGQHDALQRGLITADMIRALPDPVFSCVAEFEEAVSDG